MKNTKTAGIVKVAVVGLGIISATSANADGQKDLDNITISSASFPIYKHSPRFLALVESYKKDVPEITPEELVQYPKAQLIDVREKAEWDNGHITHVLHLSKGVIESDIGSKVPDLNTPIILYCSGGYRSILAAYNLKKMGYQNVYSLKGGYKAYLTWMGIKVSK